MTYSSAVWHMPKDVTSRKLKGSTDTLPIMQNKSLGTIAGGFKANPFPVLGAEAFIALDRLHAKAGYRLRVGGQVKFITKACETIANNQDWVENPMTAHHIEATVAATATQNGPPSIKAHHMDL